MFRNAGSYKKELFRHRDIPLHKVKGFISLKKIIKTMKKFTFKLNYVNFKIMKH